MRNKGKFEYVDELRKINTIQKMGIIDSFYPETFEDTKQDNTKFIRYKQEIGLDVEKKKERLLFSNNIITDYKQDIEPDCHDRFLLKNDEVTKDIDYYHQWSDSLNQEIKHRDYEHRFYFQKANPPPRLKEDKDKNKKEEDGTGARLRDEKQADEPNEDDANIDLPHRGKYNFQEITKYLYNRDMQKDEKEAAFLRDMSLKNEITEYRKLKNLEQIDTIGEFNEEFGKFNYYIQIPPEDYPIDFIDNSVVASNNALKLDYFRDIGRPSRDIVDYTIKNYNKMKLKQEDDSPDIGAVYDQEKRELLYLYLLKEEQLKVNKAGINFFDLSNIIMGRITSLNAHMCIRNEKVTKAQYMKLLKKMEKYDMRENQGGKPKQDKLVGTQELEDMNDEGNGNLEQGEEKITAIDIDRAIEEINKIKKEVKMLENPTSSNSFDKNNFNSEVYKKLQRLLRVLYNSVIDHMDVKYPISQIRSHLHEIKGTNSLGYEKLRVLLFVADCYEEIFAKQSQNPNLRDIANNKQQNAPCVTKYKGKKVTAQDIIQTKKIYGFNARNTDRSKSPLSKTPRKTQRIQQPVRTPLTKNYAEKQRYDQSTTPVKLSATAKK